MDDPVYYELLRGPERQAMFSLRLNVGTILPDPLNRYNREHLVTLPLF